MPRIVKRSLRASTGFWHLWRKVGPDVVVQAMTAVREAADGEHSAVEVVLTGVF